MSYNVLYYNLETLIKIILYNKNNFVPYSFHFNSIINIVQFSSIINILSTFDLNL